MGDRTLGLLLFLPVPVTLFLLTRFPLGPPISLALGILLVLSHRFYARPFALSRAPHRCLWCGAAAGGAVPGLHIREPGGVTIWRVCGPAHARKSAAFFTRLDRWRQIIRAGILGSLLVYLVMTLATIAGPVPPWSLADAVAVLQAGVAVTVLPVGWAAIHGGATSPERAPRAPFPVHVQALVGTLGVVWLFRIIGLAWLAMATLHFTAGVPPAS